MSDSFPGSGGGFPPPQGGFGNGGMPPGSGLGPTPRSVPGVSGPAPSRGTTAKPSKVVTQRSLSIYKIGIVMAILIGAVAAVAIFIPAKATYVVEANANIPALALVTSADMKAVPLPLGDIQSNAFTGTSAKAAISNAVKMTHGEAAAYPISTSQQLTPILFTALQGSLGTVGPQYRLISVSASTATAVGGSLRPGDHVDVIAVLTYHSVTMAYVATADVPIVAVSTTTTAVPTTPSKTSNTTGSSGTSSSTTGVYVLRVPVADVLSVTLADSQGTIYLAYLQPGANPLPLLPESVSQALCARSTAANPATAQVCPPSS